MKHNTIQNATETKRKTSTQGYQLLIDLSCSHRFSWSFLFFIGINKGFIIIIFDDNDDDDDDDDGKIYPLCLRYLFLFGYIRSITPARIPSCVTIVNLFVTFFLLFNKISIWSNRKGTAGAQECFTSLQASYIQEMLWNSFQVFTCLSHALFFSETEKRAWRLRINRNAVRHAMHDITTPLTAKMMVRLR